MKLSNNYVLITGGSSGIGLALAEHFLNNNNRVLICARNKQKLQAAQKKNPALEIFQCDLSKIQEMQNLLSHIHTNFNKLNVLVNNAGIQYNYRFDDGKSHLEKIEEEMNINLLSPLRLTDLLLPLLLQTDSAIINVSSALSIVPKESAPIYCASKAAIHIFTKSLRYQLEHTTVKIFEVVPALVETDMTRGRGTNKMSPSDVAKETLQGLKRDNTLIKIGKTKILSVIARLLPSLADKIIRHG